MADLSPPSPRGSPPAPTPAEAVRSQGCPICFLLHRDEFEEICRWVGGTVADGQYRLPHEPAAGFCNHHAWLLGEIHSPASGSKLNDLLAAALLARLDTAADGVQTIADWLRNSAAQCPLCEYLGRRESAHLQALLTWLAQPGAWEEYERSTGLCLPHLQRCSPRLAGESLVRRLLHAQAAQIERLQLQMRACATKLASGQRWEISPDEWAAWRRATEKLGGCRGLVWP
ncbi:MAG TPA: DUF6062 family protein [Candidatus Paceibacterota bacterium]|nr:DUF6062 family protein [Candidatus Paceibacterota bacterium]